MTIGERIRAARKEKLMTQKQLGEKCGMADSAIRKYESGSQNPKIETLQRIAAALDADVAVLMGTDPVPQEEEPTEEELRVRLDAALEKLNLYGLKKVAEYAEDLAEPRYREMTKEERRALYGNGGPRKRLPEKVDEI